VKNDLPKREDIKGIIQRPIWSRFGIRRPTTALGNDIQACQMAFNIVCTYIGIRSTLLIKCGHSQVGGKCRKKLLLGLAKVVWST
jgi:hypothetical protein